MTDLQWPALWSSLAGAVGGGLGMYFGIGGLFEYFFYRRRRLEAESWKCQPRRWLAPKMRRQEVLLGTANMTAASIATGLLIYYLKMGGSSGIYYDFATHGPLASVLLMVAYFLLTDCGLYWAHRLYHRPNLFKWVHRVHHRFTAPTAFTAMAMHPLEFATYQSIMLAPLFFFPMHVAGVIAILLYQNYVALVDHSGIKLYSIWPWQPPSMFHDDHHVHFHVNYGQNLGVWDRIFGTWRRQGRRYGIEVFGGKGAPVGDGPAPLVEYRRPTSAERAAREAGGATHQVGHPVGQPDTTERNAQGAAGARHQTGQPATATAMAGRTGGSNP